MDFSQLIDLSSTGLAAEGSVIPDEVAGYGSQLPACPLHASNDK